MPRGSGLGDRIPVGFSRCKLLHIEWMDKIPLYSTGNYTQYPVINYKREEYEKQVYITESLCYTAESNTTL